MNSSNLRRAIGGVILVALTLTMSTGCGTPKQSQMEQLLVKQKARASATTEPGATAAGEPEVGPIANPDAEPIAEPLAAPTTEPADEHIFVPSVEPTTRPPLTAAEAAELEAMERGEAPSAPTAGSIAWQQFRADIDLFVNDGDAGIVADIAGQESNYSDFFVHEQDLAADLYWKGDVPHVVLAVIAKNPAITVRLHASKYSLRELIRARDRLAKKKEWLAGTGFTLLTWGPDHGASGLNVELVKDPESKGTPATVDQLTAMLDKHLKVDVTVTTHDKSPVTFF